MPHWLTPVCDDQPVSHPMSRCEPSSSQRCRVGASPERSARSSTALARPSSWTKTTPGTSVTVACRRRRRARRAAMWSNHESSSSANAHDTSVVMAARPMTTATLVQKPDSSTPGSRSSSNNTARASRAMAPRPRVSTEIGTTTNASAGQTTALRRPMTKPASNASLGRSIVKPGRIPARSQRATAVTTVTATPRPMTRDHNGRSAAGRTTARLTRPPVRSLARASSPCSTGDARSLLHRLGDDARPVQRHDQLASRVEDAQPVIGTRGA